jgi:hypothetical protein
MTCWSTVARRVLLLGALLAICLGPAQVIFGAAGLTEPAKQGEQFGRILSVRKSLRTPYFLSRYPQIHYYNLYITLHVSGQTYCTEYETPVLDEIEDITSATNRDLVVVVKGPTITIRTPRERKLKTRLINGNQC